MQQYRKNLGKVSLTAEGVWDIKSKYDVLSIVYDEHTQHGFISKQPVPIGVDLYNSQYWMPLNVSGYTDSNIIILNKKTSDASIEAYTLEEAVKSIASVGRKPGCILGFYNSNVNRLDIGGRWEIWQFNSTTISEWEDLTNWQNIYYNYNQFVGWYRNEEQLKINNPYPEIGCYAYVGNILNEAVVYRCDIKHTWVETIQHAWDYVKIIINGTVTVGENGNWFNDGVDTGILASIKGDTGLTPFIRYNTSSNKLEYSYDKVKWIECSDYISTLFRLNNNKLEMSRDNANWNPVSDYIAAWFRWQATAGDTQANNVGRIQMSRDNGKTWTNMSNDFTNNLHISRYIGVNESLPTSGIAEGTIYAKGPYYAEDDTLNDNPIYRLWVYAWKGNTLAWQDNGEFTSIAAGVVQETGDSETEVMSQKAVTEKLSELGSNIYQEIGNKVLYNIPDDTIGGDTIYAFDFPCKKGNILEISHKLSTNLGLYPINKDGNTITIINVSNKPIYYTATEDVKGFSFWRSEPKEGDVITVKFDGNIDKEIALINNFNKEEIVYRASFDLDYNLIGDTNLSIPFKAKKGTKIHFSHSSPNANALYPHNENGVIGGIIIYLNNSEVIWEATENIIGFGFWRAATDKDTIDIYINGNTNELLDCLNNQVLKELGNSVTVDIDYHKMGDSNLSIPFLAKKGDIIHFTHTSPNINNLYPHNKHGFISGIIIYLRDGETTWTATEDIIGFAFWRQAVDSDTINISVKGNVNSKIQEAIEKFGVSSSTNILDLHPDKYMIPLLANYKWNGEVTATEFGHEPLVLMHFSDIHGDAERLKRVVEFKNHYTAYIDDAVYTGDATETYFDYYNGKYTLDDSSWDWWRNAGAGNILNVMGDHDSMGGSSTLSGGIKSGKLAYSQKKVCERFITPFEESWGLTNHPTNATYWYKDYENSSVRLIALDNIHYKETLQLSDGGTTKMYPLDNEPTDNGEQLAWFVEALTDAMNKGLSVIVATHSPYKQEPIKCTFMSLDGRYYESGNLPLELINAVQAFIDNGGKFVTWLTGDFHVDVFAKIKGYPKQLLISIDTARGVRENGQMWSFNNKPNDTLAMDCFNLVSVDVDKGYIRLHRIGSMYDRQGREIVGLVYDYVNQTLIYNS